MTRSVVDVAFMRPVDGGLLLFCVECSAELRVALPAQVDELVGVTRDFTRRHRPCQLRAMAAKLEAEAAP